MAGASNPPLLLLTSPLGDDTLPFQEGTLHAIGLEAREWLSKPFEIALTVVSTPIGIIESSGTKLPTPSKGASGRFSVQTAKV